MIEEYYASLGDYLYWSRDRALRLCNALQLTPDELAAFLRIKPFHMAQYLQRSNFPATIELHLTLIERSLLPSSDKPSVFPNIRD